MARAFEGLIGIRRGIRGVALFAAESRALWNAVRFSVNSTGMRRVPGSISPNAIRWSYLWRNALRSILRLSPTTYRPSCNTHQQLTPTLLIGAGEGAG